MVGCPDAGPFEMFLLGCMTVVAGSIALMVLTLAFGMARDIWKDIRGN